MKNTVSLILALIFLSACSRPATSTISTSSSTGSAVNAIVSGANVLAINMGCGYVNEPCVSVTICTPGTSDCQTIPNILLDTGSYGLRLFSSAVNLNLLAETDANSQTLAECVSYADGSNQWGPVKIADVRLGDDLASAIPVHIIDSTFATAPSNCADADVSSDESGFNGILGVGLFSEDCGASCISSSRNGIYYACTSSSCTGTTVALTQQVVNPVSRLDNDSNGVMVVLPSVAAVGAATAQGSLVLGIGTRANNIPASLSVLPADSSGNFKTTYGGRSYSAFIDSGSNGVFFPSSTIAACASSGSMIGFYCPSSTLAMSAVQIAASGLAQKSVSFQIANAGSLYASGNLAFNNLAGSMTSYFAWGLPFFLGRTVFVGIENKVSSLGTGPYWAY